VLANAGIMAIAGEQGLHREAYIAGIDVMLNGVSTPSQLGHSVRPRRRTRRCNRHHQLDTGLYGGIADGNPGVMGYIVSKHGVVGLTRAWANALAPERIRVNVVHATGVNSPMITNEAFGRFVQECPTIAAKPAKSSSRRERIDRTRRHEHDLAPSVRHGPLHHRVHCPCRCRFHEQVAARLRTNQQCNTRSGLRSAINDGPRRAR
jgi:NAD(P)-dependent dehydrogenase (short-subunit alcohol dehydrogenase family)